MREVADSITEGWQAQLKIGDKKPTVRATIQKMQLRRWSYDTAAMKGGDYDSTLDRHTNGTFTSAIFGNYHGIIGLRNIKSCTWTRTLDQDAATCTLVLLNSEITPIGAQEYADPNGEFDQPGYFTFSRGTEVSQNRWGYGENGWTDVLVPDNMVKTFEGYGEDLTAHPDSDPNLVQTGVWIIDTVTYNQDGTITLEMRDLARLLLDQIAYPPIVPFSEYPMAWSILKTDSVPGRDVQGGHYTALKGLASASSSNDLYVGKGITNGNVQYVDSHGGVYGHYASHALTNNTLSENTRYWLSTAQDHQRDVVWWQANLNDHTTALSGLRIQTHNSAIVYVSLLGKNGWIGRKKVPYSPVDKVGDIDIGADIPFVTKIQMEAAHTQDITLPRKYSDIRAIRLSFTFLTENSYGKPHSFQSSLMDLQIYTASSVSQLSFGKGQVMKTVGNYNDYTQVVRWACCWAGFWHPDVASGDDWIKIQANDENGDGRIPVHLRKDNKVLARGGIWGNMQPSGTKGIADLTADLFDKKPLMDMINYVRDLLGFTFWIDEYGAAQWRLPNIWEQGNYIWEGPYESRELSRRRTSSYVTLDETNSLFEYNTTLSSANIRDRIFVANSTGHIGTVIKGYVPNEVGFRRIAGWTDQRFATKRETVVMADMIAARSMFDYRRGHAKIAGHPGIQIDDQIRIFERVTNESYFHYVLGITSTLDMDEGTWDYDLDTHWLGERISDAWVVKVDQLDAATKAYLNIITGGTADG